MITEDLEEILIVDPQEIIEVENHEDKIKIQEIPKNPEKILEKRKVLGIRDM